MAWERAQIKWVAYGSGLLVGNILIEELIRTVDAFARRMRTQIDLSQLAAELEVVTVETVQPRQVSLWLAARRRPVS